MKVLKTANQEKRILLAWWWSEGIASSYWKHWIVCEDHFDSSVWVKCLLRKGGDGCQECDSGNDRHAGIEGVTDTREQMWKGRKQTNSYDIYTFISHQVI
ncbi:hypothetical protein KP79_PYT17840 [Mizuhopecten yessoensis]|uniref:Uncharacterized protein n=1 Tax=Mizuhopecten yessoensis TaxID=6573 RepID=A0A210QRW2_MIZYE|nr:hypothetical protein KP79_PYT17840 [Mizuhopecten yessoensis]